ncbi:MAG: DNA polymerase III subunit chi [Pseudomonadales bacterium]|nr:DNA polymerase III subunit chi [Gammaproteobacteria bacterium]NNL56181.1 DNA polymerase III subunit chi [Pseudomonadales bacterium]
MTQVDFYIAPGSEFSHCLTVACRVAEKAWRKNHHVYIHTADAAAMQTVDDLLWSFRPNSFVPHRHEHSEQAAPENAPDVLIACSGTPFDHHDVLINLTDQTPDFFARFTRIAEIVAGDESSRARSRERYKYYRQRGFPLEVHNL